MRDAVLAGGQDVLGAATIVPASLVAGSLAIVGRVVWMVLTGGLVPGRIHTEMMADKDMQITAWREAAHAGDRQVDALLEVGHVAEQMFRALPTVEPSGDKRR